MDIDARRSCMPGGWRVTRPHSPRAKMLDRRNDSRRYEFLSRAVRKPVGEQIGLDQCDSDPTRVWLYFRLRFGFGLILPPGSLPRLPPWSSVFSLILPSKPLMPGFFIVPCGADPATARPREYAFQPLRKPAHSAFVVLYGQRCEAVVYRLPRPRSDSTLSIETETAPCEHPKSERVRIRGQLWPQS
jgi:hypothetical protein